MKTHHTIIILGKIPSKKNRYHVSKWGGLYQDKEVADWMYSEALKLRYLRIKTITKPCGISVVLYTDNLSDIDNQLTTLFDVMQKAKVVKNDRLFFEVSAKKVLQKPFRAEITIYEI